MLKGPAHGSMHKLLAKPFKQAGPCPRLDLFAKR